MVPLTMPKSTTNVKALGRVVARGQKRNINREPRHVAVRWMFKAP